MFFGRPVSLWMAFAAIAGIFREIPIVSDWAFWFMVGTYLVWLAVHRLSKNRFNCDDVGCDCGGLRLNPNSQQLRTLDYDSRLSHHSLRHRVAYPNIRAALGLACAARPGEYLGHALGNCTPSANMPPFAILAVDPVRENMTAPNAGSWNRGRCRTRRREPNVSALACLSVKGRRPAARSKQGCPDAAGWTANSH
jgi:hypothetical protein